MPSGTVKWFNEKKGFGFIKPDEGAQDVFCHRTAVVAGAPLNEGDRVEFEVVEDTKGKKAQNVKKV